MAVIDLLSKMYKDVLPEIAKNIAEPMSKIGDIKIYGNTGQEASGISGNVPLMMKKTMDSKNLVVMKVQIKNLNLNLIIMAKYLIT